MAFNYDNLYALIPSGVCCCVCMFVTILCVLCIVICVKNEDEDEYPPTTPAMDMQPTVVHTPTYMVQNINPLPYGTHRTMPNPVPTPSFNPEIY